MKTLVSVVVDLAFDDTDEKANLAEARSEVVHMDEDTVLVNGLGRGHHADEELDTVTRICYNFVQDMTLLVTILVVGCTLSSAGGSHDGVREP